MKYILYTIFALAAGLPAVAQQPVPLTPQQQVGLWLKQQKAAPGGGSALPLFQTLAPVSFAGLRTAGCGTSFCPVNSPLPVKSIRLEGFRLNNTQAQLTFITIGEFETKGYRIERASALQPAFFDSMTYRVSLNNEARTEYRLTDANAQEETTFYRVRQIDNNGQFRYSNTITVKGAKSGLGITVAPNPGRALLSTFSLSGVTNEWVAVSVANNGGVVLFQVRQFVLAGSQLQNVKLPSLPAGVYYITATTTTKSATAKWVVIN